MRRLSSHLLSTPRGLLPNRVVTVSDEGVIVDISETGPEEPLDRLAGVEFFSGILIPGLLNAHCHLELSHLRSTIPAGVGFAGFVEAMKRAPRKGSAEATGYWDAKMWADGVSEVRDICNGGDTFALKTKSPVKYRNFIEIFGQEDGRRFELCAQAHAMGLDACVTPHALYSLDGKTFARTIEQTPEAPLSIHFMESDYEVDDPAERLIRQVPPDRSIALVHNCCVTQREIDVIMEHFTASATWVLCPGSNRYISGLVPPLGLLRKNKLRIAVGTDSLASNDTLSLVKELALLASLSDAPLAEMLGWISADTIEVGRSPGLVNLTGVDLQSLAPTENARTKRII